jgi:hypothetical protein
MSPRRLRLATDAARERMRLRFATASRAETQTRIKMEASR